MAKRTDVPAKPLFASAETISYSSSKKAEEGNEEDLPGTNDLEKLNVNLASSTLEAILAIQKAPKPVCQPSPSLSENSSSENEKRICPGEHLSDYEADIHQPSSDIHRPSSDSHRPSSSSHRQSSDIHRTSSHRTSSSSHRPSSDTHRPTSSKRERSRERHNHNKKKRKHKHKKHDNRSPSPDRRHSPSEISQFHKGKTFLDDIPNLRPENAFQIDRKANKDLKRYESVSKFHMARYKLACANLVGNSNMFVDFRARDGGEKPHKKKRKIMRYFDRDSVRVTWRKGFSCKSDRGSSKLVYQPDFINVSKDLEENKNSNNAIGTYSFLDEATSLYVHGKGKTTSTTYSSDEFIMDEIFEKVAKFNQRTREEPHNVDLWLEFVKFQDVVAMEDKQFKKQALHLRDVYRPSKSVIDKKLSILEKAVELNPSSLELKRAQLELYQDVWDSEKVHKAWEDILFVHSSNVDLWRHYLSRQQSRLNTFSFSRMVKKYHQCFQTLVPILDGHVKVVNKFQHLEENLIGLFYQYSTFLHQCGYTERAVASFQAMIEMNLFCPPSLNLSASKERRVKFEAFWESSVPKFGDLNAKGWTDWDKRQEDSSKPLGFLPVSIEDEEESILTTALPKSVIWSKMEKVRQDTYWLPWKPDESKGETEESCEDPDRLVLYEDISPAVFRLTKSESCLQLVCLFLSFLGISSDGVERIVGRVLGEKRSLFAGLLLDQMHQIEGVSFFKPSIDVGGSWKPHKCLVDFTQQTILQAEKFFVSRHREVFTLLRLDLELQKTGTLNIEAMSAICCKEIKKFGKNLLKESHNRNNLVVWDTYIRLLWVLSEKIEETVSMLDVALGISLGSNSLSDQEKAKGICLLCRTFAEIMLNFEPLEYVTSNRKRTAPSVEDRGQVITCMGALVENKKFKPRSKVDSSPTYVLRIRKLMSKFLEQFVCSLQESSQPSYCDSINAFVQCYSLFEYCAVNFHNANEIFVTARSAIKNLLLGDMEVSYDIKCLLKDLYISQIFFISNAMHIESIPLSHVRTVLDEALREFPDNGHFHRAFWEVESGSFLAGRLRKFYDTQLKSLPSVPSTVFAVLSELKRLDSLRQMEITQSGVCDTGLVHRIRSLFQHCLEVPVCVHCPLLWRMWMAFEVQLGQLTRAKGILYRALQSCPWAKSIYIDGIAIFGDEELHEMCDLMTEKEVRVYLPLEELDLLLHAEKESEDEETREGDEETREGDEETREGDEETREENDEETREGDEETREGDEETREGDEETREGDEETREGDEETREGDEDGEEEMSTDQKVITIDN